ncbi:S24 family peptidase [Erythrobacter sp. SCSIO 43205]|uniref:LexA family protein n=1 Tax=Erythrobacter sp. SCSIO 43205 TaxID=2779361 RepID=UPI001CA8BF34|nr:S24 family peptidase [Erythrobacter sp. SCSIO 43205]UAB76992.1 S24 family peptidase [Erythrobacter sp. SCSIO 43205]
MTQQPRINVPALKKAIIEATGPGKKMSRRKLSLLASGGKNPDLVRDLINRGQDKKVTVETLTGLASALERDHSDFLLGSPSAPVGAIRISVVGKVEAGAWRESEEWPEEDRYEIEVMPSPFASSERFGLRVEGYSMDKLFLPGTILDCFKLYGADGLTPEPGDVVIVQRRRGALIETTCKRLERLADGAFQLRAESTRPEFAEPIPIGAPSEEHFGDDETTIIGIVNAAVTPLLNRRAS